MRLSVTAIAMFSAFAAVWAQASGPSTKSSGVSYQPDGLAERMRAGLLARLDADSAIGAGARDLHDLVLGAPVDAGLWSFRARAPRTGDGYASQSATGVILSDPVYGRAAALCDIDLQRAACWRVTMLEIDGRPVSGATGTADR